MSKWIAEFELEDGDTMPEHMDLEYIGVRIDFHCKPQEPTTKNDLVVDCISRAEMLEYQQYLHGKMPNEENHKLWKFIKGLPSVTPIRAKGHWIVEKSRGYLMRNGCCSNCKDFYTNDWKEMNYCPNCGADMREVVEE